jgi:hypothetical protein
LKGPLQVVSHDGPSYILKDLLTHKVRKNAVHISRLKQFQYDPTRTSPRDAAQRDVQEFVLHEIRAHRYRVGAKSRPQGMEFQVRWLGYGQEDDTWESWNELRNTKVVHRYLHGIGKENLIPREHRRVSYEDSDEEE